MGYILLGTLCNFLFVRVMRWIWTKHSDLEALILITVVLSCGGCAYTLDRGLHATPEGFSVSEPVLMEEIEMLPLEDKLVFPNFEKMGYLEAENSIRFYYEGEDEIAVPAANKIDKIGEEGKSAYLVASDGKFYFYREVNTEFTNPGEKSYATKEIAANTVTIIETEDTPKYQVYEREYKGIPSIWSFALKTYTEQEVVVRIPANGILAMGTVY